jgi:hypothetical protein
MLELIQNREFMNEAVQMEGKAFVHCKFTNVAFVIESPNTFWGECNFQGACRFSFAGPAAEWASFMRPIAQSGILWLASNDGPIGIGNSLSPKAIISLSPKAIIERNVKFRHVPADLAQS